ncbi:MAG TPA: LytTR family DNA-binding domain-containing protein [Dissulfurispiraceae bacterium]|nr:LytTR family DNA-binding domain-containing protein [Dissulfurispiraceae bacterium]
MNSSAGYYSIGLVLLSSDFRVIGMSDSAKRILGPAMHEFGQHILKYHPRKSHDKIKGLLSELCSSKDDVPVAMIIDVLNKVLMINLHRIKTSEPSVDFLYAMTFVDVSKETEARVDPKSGLIGLKKFPVCNKGSFQFIDLASICLIQADGNYSKLFTHAGNHLLHMSLKSIMQRYASPHFFRAHKSCIVNITHIRKLDLSGPGHAAVILDKSDLPPAPIARRRIKDLKEALARI